VAMREVWPLLSVCLNVWSRPRGCPSEPLPAYGFFLLLWQQQRLPAATSMRFQGRPRLRLRFRPVDGRGGGGRGGDRGGGGSGCGCDHNDGYSRNALVALSGRRRWRPLWPHRLPGQCKRQRQLWRDGSTSASQRQHPWLERSTPQRLRSSSRIRSAPDWLRRPLPCQNPGLTAPQL